MGPVHTKKLPSCLLVMSRMVNSRSFLSQTPDNSTAVGALRSCDLILIAVMASFHTMGCYESNVTERGAARRCGG